MNAGSDFTVQPFRFHPFPGAFVVGPYVGFKIAIAP